MKDEHGIVTENQLVLSAPASTWSGSTNPAITFATSAPASSSTAPPTVTRHQRSHRPPAALGQQPQHRPYLRRRHHHRQPQQNHPSHPNQPRTPSHAPRPNRNPYLRPNRTRSWNLHPHQDRTILKLVAHPLPLEQVGKQRARPQRICVPYRSHFPFKPCVNSAHIFLGSR